MSDWTRYGRDEDQRRHGFEERERRDVRRDAPYGEAADWRERRSFGGPEAPDYRADPRRSGGERYGQGYDRGWNRADARRDYAEPVQGRIYGRGAPGGQPGYGHEGVFGGNEWLERFSDGRTGVDFAGHHFQGHGEHRGRGPKNYTRSDERIHEDVNDRLADDSWLDASEVEVQVANGEVTLNGHVASREDKRHAEDLADRVSGVRHVQNNLRIQPHAASQAQAPATGPTPGAGGAQRNS